MSAALEVKCFDNVIIFGDSLDSAPKVKSFKVVLCTKGFNAGLQVSSLFDWKSLSDSVDELELCLEIDDVHLSYFLYKDC